MEMAQRHNATEGPKHTESNIPDEYQEYLDVFEKKAAERLPKHKEWDHAIDLKPDFKPKRFEAYKLSPREEELMNKFVNENLQKDYICKSQSPMASPLFFVAKKSIDKDGQPELRPCQDY